MISIMCGGTPSLVRERSIRLICRPRKMLPNESLLAKLGVDTAENGPRKGLKNGTLEKAPMVIRLPHAFTCPLSVGKAGIRHLGDQGALLVPSVSPFGWIEKFLAHFYRSHNESSLRGCLFGQITTRQGGGSLFSLLAGLHKNECLGPKNAFSAAKYF